MTQTQARDHAPHLENLFTLEIGDDAYEIQNVEGQVPPYIRGSYYLNGPCLFGRQGQRYRHWLDGDGLVTALHFRENGIQIVHRFVQSAKYQAEQEEGRLLYRAFGTAFEGDRLKRGIGLESSVNVSAYTYDGRLLAFGEQGLPWELDPQTLETRGEYTFGGRLNAISPLSAHPCFDPETGDMYNFGISFSARQPSLTIYKFSKDGELLLRKRLPIDHPVSVHDFGLSPSYVIFYLSPYLLDVEALIQGGESLMDALRWQPEKGSQLLVISRETGEQVAKIPIEAKYCLHLVNHFEEGGKLHVDVVELDRPVYDQYQVIPDLFPDVEPGCPVRFEIDTQSWEITGREEIDYWYSPDFPAIDPRLWGQRYDDFWMLGISKTGEPGRKFFDELVHLSWSGGGGYETWKVPPGEYLGGEPVFLGDPESLERGSVICQHLDAESGRGAFLLFDAFDVARGPVAKLPLKNAIPPCFHASFHPA